MSRLTGKAALVTGAGQGIGKAIALRLAKEGADVAVNGLRLEPLRETTSEITALGCKSFPVKADVTKWGEVKEMVDIFVNEFGRMDILVNNAGVVTVKPFLDVTEKEWNLVMDINVKGIFLCCKAAVPYMMRAAEGKIINISSEAGKLGFPLFVPYCASKHAVIGITRALAKELAQCGIKVNAVCPTATRGTKMRRYVDGKLRKLGVTNMLTPPPLGRMGKPEDVAGVVAFLASEDSDFLTGQAINVSGGTVTA